MVVVPAAVAIASTGMSGFPRLVALTQILPLYQKKNLQNQHEKTWQAEKSGWFSLLVSGGYSPGSK
jgi:hypothetical protein